MSEEAKQKDTLTTEVLAYWLGMPGWRIREAAALFLDLDPDSAIAGKLNESSQESFLRLEKKLLRAKAMGELSSPSKPREFVEWAMSNDIAVPENLLEGVSKGKRLRNWQTIAGNRLKRLKALQAKNPSIDDISPTGIASLYTILLSIAEEKYGFIPTERNTASKEIAATVLRCRFKSPKEQAIRKWLSTAHESVDGDRMPRI